ncbi:MAG: hypothetical protein IKO14_05415 [Oscillibacter sp.]|nr:hypothetical protein [Oscillibacter sp.]
MADSNNVFGLDPKSKVVDTPEISIRGHLLRWSDTVIQISNISMVSTAEVPAPHISKWFFVVVGILGLFGIYLLDVSSKSYYYDEAVQVFGVLVTGFSILFFLLLLLGWWLTRNDKDKTYLNLALNSGNVYSFVFTDKEFMRQVLQVFANIFESGTTKETNININTQVGKISDHGVGVQLNVEK